MDGLESGISGLLGTARRQMDLSLANERSKTDDSIALEQKASEVQADFLVAKNRSQTDSEQSVERNLRDAKKEEARSSADDHDLESERALDDINLKQERRDSDLAQMHERANADAAIAKERRRNKLAVEALFALERGVTDADLLRERNHVDSEAELFASDLNLEVDAHNETKALMAVMSRDLKDPLNSILKLGEMLQASFISENVVSPQIHRLLGIIRRNSSKMEKLVADLLDLDVLNEGNLPLNLANEDLVDVLSECGHIYGIVAKAKNIGFTISHDSSPLMGTFDRDRILQVLSNLIQYALDHTPKDGMISIHAAPKDSQIEVSVVDDGDGSAITEQKKVFEKFSRAPKQRRHLELGLYVAKGIIEAHGCTFSHESNPGKGSAFRFTLPLMKR